VQNTKTPVRLHIAALLVALSIGAPVAAQQVPTAPLANITADLKSIHIDNFGRINANYYRGAQPKGRDFADLAKMGVKTMIDLTNGDGDTNEGRLAQAAGLQFFSIPMSTRVVPTSGEIAQFLRIVNDPANQPVYVHCVGGKHRTGVMTAVYRMIQDKWAPDKAFQEMKRFKFGADFLHPEFKQFVYAYKPDAVAIAAAEGAGAAQ
jgi:protein tyrosine/serine phosphatase